MGCDVGHRGQRAKRDESFVLSWYVRTLFYRHAADTSPGPGWATALATADASYATTLPNARKRRHIRRRRSSKLSNKERGTNLSFFICPSGWLLLLLWFYHIDKDISCSGIVIRRPRMVRGGRGWQWKVRGDGSGKRYTKTILTMTYLSLIFVFGAVQPLTCASTVTYPIIWKGTHMDCSKAAAS